MEKIKVTFLGTSNAIPTVKRSHTAILLQYKKENILIDCGEGTQRQFKIAGISPSKLTRILLTHWHGDHVLGLPGLFQTLKMNDYKKTLNLYIPKGTKRYVDFLAELFKIKIDILPTSRVTPPELIFFRPVHFFSHFLIRYKFPLTISNYSFHGFTSFLYCWR